MTFEEVEQRAKHVLKWLAIEGNSRWLIIFDNIDQYSSSDSPISDTCDLLEEFFPSADHGSILITSRLQGLTELGKSFPIHRLDLTTAIQLLLQSSRLSIHNIAKELESNPGMKGLKNQGLFMILIHIDIIKLASRLDGLPLAIAIAGAFMRSTGTSITEYLQYYSASWSELQLQSKPERQYQQGNMLQTWMISYREIHRRDPNAAKLLLFLAHFDNRDIWFELVNRSCYSSNLPVWLERSVSSEIAFKVGVKSLIEFSLLEVKEQGGYAMHPVVQDWCIHLTNTTKSASQIQLNELALVSVGYNVPSASVRNYSEVQRRLMPHANYVRHKVCPGCDVAVWEAFHSLGELYKDQGKLQEAEEMYQRALTGKEEALGREHMSTLSTVNNLGDIYNRKGELQEAEKMLQRALTGKEEALGPDHTSTLNTVHNLGNLYTDQGKLQEAMEMYRRALTGYEKALGPDHTSTLDTVHNLGYLYRKQGILQEAEALFRRALAGYEKALGPDHTATLRTTNNFGNLYNDQGKLQEAEKMYQRALAGYEKALGPDHTSTLKTVNNLGNIYNRQEKLQEAGGMYQRALAGYEKALGPDHTSTLKTVNNLGNLYKNQGKLQAAEEMYQRALAGKEKVFGPDHMSTLNTINNLGNIYKHQGELQEAEKMYQRALAGKEKVLGPDHKSTLNTIHNLGNLYTDQGKLQEAIEMYQRVLAGREKSLGPSHTSTLSIVSDLGDLYNEQGKLQEAEEMYLRALAGYETVSLDHASTLVTVINLGNLYSYQGKLLEAEEMFKRGLAGYGKALGLDHSLTRRLVDSLLALSIEDVKRMP
jgi:tetratricopeptide (TPR) repeat protein